MIPLYTTSQIKTADNYAIKKLGIPGIVLMENAAISIVNAVKNNIPEFNQHNRIGIVCGKGNNGGDGFAVARHLVNEGFDVTVCYLADSKILIGDARTNFNILKNLAKIVGNLKLIEYKAIGDINRLKDCTIIFDALLGTGGFGELKEPYNLIVKKLNSFDAIRIAVDIPTGLNTDSGFGEVVFDADITISLAELKRGLFFGSGYKYSGQVIKGSIGIGSEYFEHQNVDDYLIEPEDAIEGIPVKNLDAHKYSSGKVLVIAGSGKLPGAAIICSTAAIKCGAGAVVLAFPESIKNTAHAKLDEVTVFPYKDEKKEYLQLENIHELSDKLKWADVIAIGPGLGREKDTVDFVNELLKNFPSKKFIIDADAITALSSGRYKRLDLSNKILTPHHKEFAELIGVSIGELQSDLLKHGKNFSRKSGSYLILKGAPTIIFTPSGESLINSCGNPGMAKFGTGDALTGILAAFVSNTSSIEDALISSVYLHSLSADILSQGTAEIGYTASDIINNFAKTVRFLEESTL